MSEQEKFDNPDIMTFKEEEEWEIMDKLRKLSDKIREDITKTGKKKLR